MLKLNPDGTADIEYTVGDDEIKVHLPVPTISQFGDIMDLFESRSDDLDLIDAQRAALSEQLEQARVSEDDEAIRKLRTEAKQLETDARRQASDTFIEAIGFLTQSPEYKRFAQDPPAWTYRAEAFLQLIRHFSTVPFLGPGGSTD